MKKKILSLFLACMVLVGCGSTEADYTSTKVEISENPVRSSTDYASGTITTSANAGNSNASEAKDDTNNNSSTSGNKPKIWFINNANGVGFSAALTNSMETALNISDYDYKFIDGQGEQQIQINAVEEAIAENVDCIALDPIKEEGFEDTLKKAKDAGIKIVLIDRQISDESLFDAWLGSDFMLEGQNAAKWLVETKGEEEEQKVVVLEGDRGSSAAIGRTNGFKETIEAYDNYEIIASESADFDKAKGKALMADYLDQYSDIDVIVSQNDEMTYGVLEALEEGGKSAKDYTIITFDGQADVFKEMINGNVDLCVECNPLLGPDSAALVAKVLAGENVDKINYVEEGVFPAEVASEEIGNRTF